MEPFKNLLNAAAAKKIANAVKRGYPDFRSDVFLKNIANELEPLELKQRMILLQERLTKNLPDDQIKSFAILKGALKKHDSDATGLSGFHVWPLTHFVAVNGLEHHALALDALYHMTQVFTAEFAIRPFLIEHEKETLKVLEIWAHDKSDHVRRLVSEGTRPLLPWGQRLPAFVKNPDRTWNLLEKLKSDPSKYVQKSVANHINDHSKNHPDWLVRKLKTWHKEKAAPASIGWIIRHGTRSLVKQGHAGALALHGITPIQFKNVSVKIKTPKVRLGEALEVELKLTNPLKTKVAVVVDCQILLLKANGLHSPKVFKGKKVELAANESQKIALRFPLRPVTTRQYYKGKHGCVLLVNGLTQKQLWFDLSF